MKIKEIIYTRKAKVNTRKYETEDIELTVTIQLDDDDTPEDAFEFAKAYVNKRVRKEVQDLRK